MEQKTYNNDMKGALWSKVSQKTGAKYLGGIIEIAGKKYGVSVFKNDKKEKESHPDFRVLISELDENRRQKSVATPEKSLSDAIDIDDLPF